MKNWYWLLLALVMLMIGCAPGYYERRPGLGEEGPGYYETKKWYQNPETEEQQRMRIWGMDSGR